MLPYSLVNCFPLPRTTTVSLLSHSVLSADHLTAYFTWGWGCNWREFSHSSTTSVLLEPALPPVTWMDWITMSFSKVKTPTVSSKVKPPTLSLLCKDFSELSPLSSASAVFPLYCHSDQYVNMLLLSSPHPFELKKRGYFPIVLSPFTMSHNEPCSQIRGLCLLESTSSEMYCIIFKRLTNKEGSRIPSNYFLKVCWAHMKFP